ncbi:hypothetical protein IJ182_05455 [bacterium]|nr:hypothetical protein [bacterium]
MNVSRIFYIVVITALISSFASIYGMNMYSKAKADNANTKVVQGSGGCPISVLAEAQESGVVYDILSPVGESSIKPIKQAPRPNTLNGKTIAVVGGSFMANVTHPEIKRLILENYPDAKVILLSEIGSAGPYPAPGIKRQQKDEFERKLKDMKVDAVISGNGGCGLCTPKEEGSCITAEYLGIPSVMIAAPGFVEQAKATAKTAGVSVQRVAEYPGAFSAHTRDELIKNTREVLWQQIVDGLTKPITNDEIKDFDNNTGDNSIVFTGNLEEVQKYAEMQGWTDGLPITPPTETVVNEFFKYTPYSSDTVIGNIPPTYRKVTVKHVATVGAMAGCPPEYMPILIAYTKAMMNGDFRKTLSSTHAWTPFVWINGPIARQLGIDSGQGEISSPNNKKIGRFIDLAMINLGGYDIKKNRMGTFGYLSSWAMAEDEEAINRIGWQPYHVQQGYNINDSTLTAASALNWGNNLTPATSDADKILELMAWDAVEKEQFALGGGTPFVYRTIFITEYVARDLARKYRDKNVLENALIELARRPVDERAYANYYANPGSSFDGRNYSLEKHKQKIAQEEKSSVTNTPKWLQWTGKSQMQTVPVMQKGKTAFVVTGDANRNKVLTVPGGGMATVKIELPSNWDSLMQELGYKPLSSFYIKPLNESYVQPVVQQQIQENYEYSQQQTQRKRPTKEQYNKMMQSRRQNSTNQTQQASAQNRRPTPEKYREIRKQRQMKM